MAVHVSDWALASDSSRRVIRPYLMAMKSRVEQVAGRKVDREEDRGTRRTGGTDVG